MQYLEDNATGKTTIEISEVEKMNLGDRIFQYVVRTIADRIIEVYEKKLVEKVIAREDEMVKTMYMEIAKESARKVLKNA